MHSLRIRRASPNPLELLHDALTAYQIVKEIVQRRRKIAEYAQTLNAYVRDYLLLGLVLGDLFMKKLRRQPYPLRNLILILLIAYGHKILRRGFKYGNAISDTP